MNHTEHLLSCLAEECTVVGQRVSKALRFGLSEVQPGQPLTNAERIAGELIDLLAVVGMLEDQGVLDVPRDPVAITRKKEKVLKFMAYAEQCGSLTPNVEVTGAARLYRAASSNRRERGRPPGWATVCKRNRGSQ